MLADRYSHDPGGLGLCVSLVEGRERRLVQSKAKSRGKARRRRAGWRLFARCWSYIKTEGDHFVQQPGAQAALLQDPGEPSGQKIAKGNIFSDSGKSTARPSAPGTEQEEQPLLRSRAAGLRQVRGAGRGQGSSAPRRAAAAEGDAASQLQASSPKLKSKQMVPWALWGLVNDWGRQGSGGGQAMSWSCTGVGRSKIRALKLFITQNGDDWGYPGYNNNS